MLLVKSNVSIAKKVSLLSYFCLYMSVNNAPAGVWRPACFSANKSDLLLSHGCSIWVLVCPSLVSCPLLCTSASRFYSDWLLSIYFPTFTDSHEVPRCWRASQDTPLLLVDCLPCVETQKPRLQNITTFTKHSTDFSDCWIWIYTFIAHNANRCATIKSS